MNIESKKFVYTTPRHFRSISFVEDDISAGALSRIIYQNMKIWGGRYNPIIPVRAGKIDSAYMDLIKPLDPDTIFYSQKVDVSIIKDLHYFNPSSYEKMDERGTPNTGGVDYHYLLHDDIRDFTRFSEKLPLLHVQGIHNLDLPAREFFEMNLGLFELYAGQENLIRGFNNISITKDNKAEINKIIAERYPYFKSLLSAQKINACIFRPEVYDKSDRFELIIADKKNPNNDLFYFWNRQLFIEHTNRLYQIIVTNDDLSILLNDPYFGRVLEEFKVYNTIRLVSQSLSAEELNKTKIDIESKIKYIQFEVVSHDVFPYIIQDYRYHNELKSERTKQIFFDSKDLLKLTPPRLTDRYPIVGGFAYDVEIEFNTPGQSPESSFKYPTGYPFYKERLNFRHDLTLFSNGKELSVDFSIPDEFNLFESRILRFKKDGNETVKTPINQVRYSTAGQSMFALIDLFGGSWSHLVSLLDDKFWLDVFRSVTDCKEQSNIPKGKGIFSYKDLVKEKKLLYAKYKAVLTIHYNAAAPGLDINKFIECSIERDMESVAYELQGLIDIGAVYMGIKVKCHTCGSKKWYALSELKDKMPCKGCNRLIIPQMEAPYYYRVNDIIINNLLSDATGKTKDFDGNYVVLQALNSLRNKSPLGFLWCCPLDYAIKVDQRNKWLGDFDIIASQDGKFIIGEAKNDASEFKPDVIEGLIKLGNDVKPDAIILAYNNGNIIDAKVQRVKDGLTDKNCEVILYKTSPPIYMSGGLFGYPNKEKRAKLPPTDHENSPPAT